MRQNNIQNIESYRLACQLLCQLKIALQVTILSYFILFYLFLTHPVLSYAILCCALLCSAILCYTMLYYTFLSINIISYLLSFHLFSPPASYTHPYLPSLSHCTYSRTYPALRHYTFFIQNYIFNLKIKSSEIKIFF